MSWHESMRKLAEQTATASEKLSAFYALYLRLSSFAGGRISFTLKDESEDAVPR